MSVKRRYLDNIDFDPNNPYHYHSNDKKIVISKEDYEKYKNDPIFSDIKDVILKHQKQYPRQEYEEYENPEYKKVYSKIRGKAPINGVNAVAAEKGFSKYSPVPEGYYRDKHGVVFDNEGNIYRPHNGPADYHNKRSIAFNTNERNGQGRPYSLGWVKVDTPNKLIRKEKQPLPVNQVMNVDQERNKAINHYIDKNKNKSITTTKPMYILTFGDSSIEPISPEYTKYLDIQFEYNPLNDPDSYSDNHLERHRKFRLEDPIIQYRDGTIDTRYDHPHAFTQREFDNMLNILKPERVAYVNNTEIPFDKKLFLMPNYKQIIKTTIPEHELKKQASKKARITP